MPSVVVILVVLKSVVQWQIQRELPGNSHQLVDRRNLKVHIALLNVQQRSAEFGPVGDLNGVHVGILGVRLLVVACVEDKLKRFVVIVESHIGDALVAGVQILARGVGRTLLQLAELNLLTEFALVSSRAGTPVE